MNTKEQINYLYEKAKQKEHMNFAKILMAGAGGLPCEGCGSVGIVSREENGKIVHVDIYDYDFKTIPCPGE